MQRRELLSRLAMASAACAAASVPGIGARARASELPTLLPQAERAENVLEIFLCGGVSQYESFYCVPEHGKTERTHYHLYADSDDMAQALAACQISSPLTEPFARDALGQDVHLGPFAWPLRQRPDVLARARITTVRHDLAPHEAAIPLMLSGRSLGNPAVAGLGAHVQQHFMDRSNPVAAPVSYVIGSSTLGQLPIDNLRVLVATGLHPAGARPLDVKVDAAGDLSTLLERPTLGARRAAHDALNRERERRFAERLAWGGTGDSLRAPAFAELRANARWLEGASALSTALEPQRWRVEEQQHCGVLQERDAVGAQVQLAVRLLNHPTLAARYVCVVDGGFVPVGNGGGGYDSHANNTEIQSRNLTYSLGALMRLIRAPGEDAPDKLDLSRTLIVLTTEFGRSPTAESGNGRAHWPYGFPTLMLGGPIRTPGIFGACDASGYATQYATPAQSRIAVLLALGIWPFGNGGFAVADVPGARSEAEAAALVLEQQLGLA